MVVTDSARGQVTLSEAVERIAYLFAAEPDEDVLEAVGADFGWYEGLPPRIELLDDGRLARLLKPITYFRGDSMEWPVPARAKLDGASIPRAFWTLIGGPFEGKYRNASIVHDRYCDSRERPWGDTHRMFYIAMRCSGVGAGKAGVMFYAVYRFGPRWAASALESADTNTIVPMLDDAAAETVLRDAEAITECRLNVAEIEALARARTAAEGAGAVLALHQHDEEDTR